MDLDEVVASSELVLEAHVVSATPVETVSGLVETELQLLVDRTFLGPDLGVRTVRLPGGVLPSGRGTLIPGMPVIAAGEDVVLMLTAPSASGLRVVVGLSQGRFRLVRDAVGRKLVVRDQESATLVDPATGTVGPVPGRELIDYAEFTALVEAASAAARARRGDAGREDR